MSSPLNIDANAVSDDKLPLSGGIVASSHLCPIIPLFTGRYNVTKRAKRTHATVPAGVYTAIQAPPIYTSQEWSRMVHPEGSIYFCRNAQLRVVTDAYMDDQSVADKVTEWVSHVEKVATQKSFDFTGKNVELFVQIDDEDDCMYYMVDHTARSLFWFDNYETSQLGFAEVSSPSHLKHLLEEAYWTHVERHCMHKVVRESNIIEEVIALLVNGAGDHMTSKLSTFPYSREESIRLMNALVPCRDQTENGAIISIVARVYSVIALNRYYIHHGEEQARLARDTGILEEQQSESFWTQPIVSAITLGASERFHSRLTSIFVDTYIYEYDWRQFMTESLKKWTAAQSTSLSLLLLHIFCFYLPVSETLALISGAFLALSIISTTLLARSFEDHEQLSTSDAHNFLCRAQQSMFGFQGIALIFSLPQAFNLWGLVFLVAQVLAFADPIYLASASAIIAISLGLFKVVRSLSHTLSRMKQSESAAV